MDLELTDDQRMLKDMLDRFVADEGGVEARRAAIRSEQGWSPATWNQMAELGLLALCLDEAQGGLGGGGTELMLVAEAFGRGLLVEPYLDNAVIAAPLLAASDEAAAADALGALVSGTQTFALVSQGVTLQDGKLGGTAVAVSGADQAAFLLVSAGDDGLFLVAGDAAGLQRTGFPLHGGGRAADLRLDGVEGVRILGGNTAADLLARAEERRVAFLAAEALGMADGALETTVDYLKTRVQFGQPIGTNQALQHRCAEMLVEIEQLRSGAILAACMLDDADAAERRRVLAAVAMVTRKTARFVAQNTVQLQGGIGVTEEHAIGHAFLRLTAIGLLMGEADGKALAALGGFVSAEPYWDAGR